VCVSQCLVQEQRNNFLDHSRNPGTGREGHLELVELVLGHPGGLESRVEEPAACERRLLRLRLVISIGTISGCAALSPPSPARLVHPWRRENQAGRAWSSCSWVEVWPNWPRQDISLLLFSSSNISFIFYP
jgi:hypothetical protein